MKMQNVEMELIEFDARDVITTSGGTGGGTQGLKVSVSAMSANTIITYSGVQFNTVSSGMVMPNSVYYYKPQFDNEGNNVLYADSASDCDRWLEVAASYSGSLYFDGDAATAVADWLKTCKAHVQ